MPGLDLDRLDPDRALVVLASGGLDSAVLLGLLAARKSKTPVHPLFVRCGFDWEEAELAALLRFCEAIGSAAPTPLQLDLTPALAGAMAAYDPAFERGYAANYIPGRNLVLCVAAAIYAAPRSIEQAALAVLAGNPYPDARPEFFAALEQTIALGIERPLRMLAPMRAMDKPAAIRLGAHLPLELTLSCARPVGERHCGDACNKCAERQKGFALAGVVDPTEYAAPPPVVDWAAHRWPD